MKKPFGLNTTRNETYDWQNESNKAQTGTLKCRKILIYRGWQTYKQLVYQNKQLTPITE